MTSRKVPILGAAAVAAATVACLIAGAPPLLPLVLAALSLAVVFPVAGLAYILVVLMAPLGLWLLRVDDFMSWTFGGREYALSLSSSVIAVALLARALIERPPTRRQLLVGVPALVLFGAGVLVGILEHGIAQTAAGARITALPVILLLVLLRRTHRDLDILLTVTAGLVVANGAAAVIEYAIGPARLISYGFEEGRAVRLIGDTFRAPGLTEVNAELGLFAGAFLLGYAALWLVRELRPRYVRWHVAAGAAAVCLALSTSRSGALLLAGGLVVAVVLNRGGGAAARRRARILGIAVVVLVVGGFVAVGATGSSSLFERFTVWGRLIGSGAPWYGLGVGGVGAATYSRAAETPPVFVDNYFVSIVLQFGYLVPVLLLGLIAWGLFRLSRRSVSHPHYVVYLAVLAGTVGGCLMIELWEYAVAMACLALFVAYAARTFPPPAPPPPAPPLEETVRLHIDPAETVVLKPPAADDTVIMEAPERNHR